jgi:hypothetical protein
MENQLCHIILKNHMEMILSKDGWNPGEEVPAYYYGEVWTISVDEIIAFRPVTDKEWMMYKRDSNMSLREFVEQYERFRPMAK